MGFKAKTCVRYNEPYHAHALTFSCFQKRLFLNSDPSARIFLESLDAARRRHPFDIWAYVVMPDHVHLLIWPRQEDYSISKILFSIKRPVSYRARKAGFCREARFWQPGGGYDRNLWKVHTIYKEIDYMHANPVRKGLCERPEEWTYSSAAYWAGQRHVPLKIDESLPPRQSSVG